MGTFLGLFLLFGAALAASICFTWSVRAIAPSIGLLDKPDARRKMHHRIIPLGGGVAIFLATVTAIAVGLVLLPNAAWSQMLNEASTTYIGLFGAAGLVLLVGLIDDRFGLRGSYKLIGQIIAASVVAWGGLQIHDISLFGWEVHFGGWSFLFTVFWLLGAMNALNLIDGADGLAGSVGVMLCLSILVIALHLNHMAEAAVAAAMVGALVGFLIFNLPPASIFLGDAGSMLIGLVTGALAIFGSYKGAATVAFMAPLAIWSIPILDSALAVIRRKLTGQSIYATDRGHLHHCLQTLGYRGWRLVLFTAAMCAVTGVAAVISVYRNNDFVAVIGVGVVIASLVAGRIFGYAEFKLIVARTRLFAHLLNRIWPGGSKGARHTHVSLQGNRDWEPLWRQIVEIAETGGLTQVHLNLNAPWLHESFYARWDAEKAQGEHPMLWRAEAPLSVNERNIGRLVVAGPADAGEVGLAFARLGEMVDSLEEQLERLSADDSHIELPTPEMVNSFAPPEPAPEPVVAVEN